MFFLFVYTLAQCRSEEVGSEHGPIPSPAFFHPRLCTTDQPGQSAIPRTDCVRVNSPDVRQQEHDGCLWSASWKVPHCGCHVPWEDVHEGGWRADAKCSEQEQVMKRYVKYLSSARKGNKKTLQEDISHIQHSEGPIKLLKMIEDT